MGGNFKVMATILEDPIVSFRNVLESAGLIAEQIIPDGQLHRIPGTGKRNCNTAGWYVMFSDRKGGVFGDWSQGFTETWQAERDLHIRKTEQSTFQHQIEQAKIEVENERRKKQADWHPVLGMPLRIYRFGR